MLHQIDMFVPAVTETDHSPADGVYLEWPVHLVSAN